MIQPCPECGCDPFLAKDYPKIQKEQEMLENQYRSVRAYHGKAQAEWDIKEIKLTEGMKYLQRKVKKQAEAIRRLEDKLKKLKQQPYKEVPCDVRQFSSRVCDNGKRGCVVTHRPPEITGM